MKKRYQIDQQLAVRQFRRRATEQNPNIQMILPMTDIVSLLRGCGLMHVVLDEEVKSLAGERDQKHEKAARTAGERKTATAWWMARSCGPTTISPIAP